MQRPASSFIGRERALARIAEAFDAGARIVTLTGPPGVGKTRLAIEFAQPRGAALCDLRDARNLEELRAVIVRELGLQLPERTDSATALGDALAARGEILLVLDNFEQLASWARESAGALSERARAARFLLTSRVRLGLEGESTIDVEPLPLPDGDETDTDAVRLFVARYASARGGRALTAGESAAVPAVVRSLDGLPLAIELAAVCGRALAPAQIVDELARPLDFLCDPAPGSNPSRGLDRAIRWSWALLGARERAALAQCSVFRGGFDLSAAREVIALDGGDVRAALAALHDHSLLQLSPPDALGREARYHLLVCVREYAAAELDRGGTAPAARARHAALYRDRARTWYEELASTGSAPAHSGLRGEIENLSEAHATALAAGDGASALSVALALAEAISPDFAAAARVLASTLESTPENVQVQELRARAWAALASARRLIGDTVGSEAACREAHSAAQADGDPGLLAEAMLAEGALLRTQAKLAGAAAEFRGVLAMAVAPRLRARAHVELAGTLLVDGESIDSRWHADEARRIAVRLGDRAMQARALYFIAASHQDQALLDEGRAHYLEALACASEVRDVRLAAVITSNLALIDQEQERFADAQGSYQRARALAAEAGDPLALATTLWDHGTCYHAQGRTREAEDCYLEALARFRAVDNRRFEAVVCAALGALTGAASGERGDDWFEQADAALGGDERDSFAIAIDAYRGLLEIERARARLSAGDAAGSSALCAAARQRSERIARRRSARARALPQDARIAASALERGLREVAVGHPDMQRQALILDLGRRSFCTPGGGLVPLATREAPWHILRALVEERLARPGRATSVPSLFGQGWPGQRASAAAAAARVHTAVWTLRKLGLNAAILRSDGGYLLDPALPVVREA